MLKKVCVLLIIFVIDLYSQVDIQYSSYMFSLSSDNIVINKNVIQSLMSNYSVIFDELDGQSINCPYAGDMIQSGDIAYFCIADIDLNRIVMIKVDLTLIISEPDSAFIVKQYDGTNPGSILLNNPRSVKLTNNCIYICDTGNSRLLKIGYDSNLNFSLNWAITNGLNAPYDIDIAPNGSLWVVDYNDDKIINFSNSGSFIQQYCSNGSGNWQLNNPQAIKAVTSSDLLVADTGNHRIVKLHISSNWQTIDFSTYNEFTDIEYDNDEIYITDINMDLIHEIKYSDFEYIASSPKKAPACIKKVSDGYFIIENPFNLWKISLYNSSPDILNMTTNSISDSMATYEYLLTKSTNVYERIVNSNNELIKTLKNVVFTDMDAHVTGEWDLTDNNNNLVPNGDYFIIASLGFTGTSDKIKVVGGSEYIELESPNGQEQLSVGSTCRIAWEDINFNNNIKLEYSINRGLTWNCIVDSLTNIGYYNWTVPDSSSDSCLIKISDAVDGVPSDTSNYCFRIFKFSITGLIIEAENLVLSGYSSHTTGGASNQHTIRLSDIPNPGNASCIFVQENGIYDFSVKYLDEWDGACTAKVYINNVLSFEWIWDRIDDGNVFIEQYCGSYYICLGDTIRIEVTNNENEYGKIDFIRFIEKPDNYWKGTIATATTWTKENSPYIITGDVTIPSGVTLTIESGTTVVFLDSDSLASGNNTNRVELIINGSLDLGNVTFKGLPGDTIGAYLSINTDFTLTGNDTLLCGPYSLLEFNGKLDVDDSTFFDVGYFSTLECHDSTVVHNYSEFTINAHSDVLFSDDCIIDSTSVINFKEETDVTFEPDVFLLGYGQIWAHEVVFQGASASYWEGIQLEGSFSSTSFFSECEIKGSTDGFIIINSSPEIKLCTIHNVEKRGFNISGSGSEPNIERNYIYSCGTYPIQIVNGPNPLIYDNKIYATNHAAVRVWNADGNFGRNEFRSTNAEGVFIYGSTSNTQFYAYNDDDDGNIFNLANIGDDGVIIEGGVHIFGRVSSSPIYHGRNIFSNRGSDYYIRNNTQTQVKAEDNYWPNGTSGAFIGDVDTSPKYDYEPVNAGPSWKKNTSPFSIGFEKFKEKDFKEAFKELKMAIRHNLTSSDVDFAIFKLAKAAIKIDSLNVFESFLKQLNTTNEQVQNQSRVWLSFIYATRGEMKNAEKIAFEAPKGSLSERNELLSLITYYNSYNDKESVQRIIKYLNDNYKDEFLEKSIEAATEFKLVFPLMKESNPQKDYYESLNTALYLFPNPFNASITISYTIEKSGNVEIKIYNLLGQEVRSLIDSQLESGIHNIKWDGIDNNGNFISTGIYFVLFKTDQNRYIQKISYIK